MTNGPNSPVNILCQWSRTTAEDSDWDQKWTDGGWSVLKMLMEIKQRLTIPSQIVMYTLTMDLVICSNTWVVLYFVELTIPLRKHHQCELWEGDAALHRPECRSGTRRMKPDSLLSRYWVSWVHGNIYSRSIVRAEDLWTSPAPQHAHQQLHCCPQCD